MTLVVELSVEDQARLEAEVNRRGITFDQLIAELAKQLPPVSSSPVAGSFDDFLGSADSGDSEWATRDIHELRHELANRTEDRLAS
jgi:hypothetical protein